VISIKNYFGSRFHYSSNAKVNFNLINLRNNLPKISDVFINKDIFDNDVKIKELDLKFANLFIFLIIFKVFIFKKDYNRVVKILFENLSAIGVDIKYIIVFKKLLNGLNDELSKDEFEVFTHKKEVDKHGFDFSLGYNDGNIKIEELFLELMEYSEKRSAIVNSKIWNKIIFILNSFYKFNLQELNTIGEVHLNKLRKEFKLLSNVDRFKEATGRKYVGVVNRPKKP
jgi:hypothetical protein